MGVRLWKEVAQLHHLNFLRIMSDYNSVFKFPSTSSGSAFSVLPFSSLNFWITSSRGGSPGLLKSCSPILISYASDWSKIYSFNWWHVWVWENISRKNHKQSTYSLFDYCSVKQFSVFKNSKTKNLVWYEQFLKIVLIFSF